MRSAVHAVLAKWSVHQISPLRPLEPHGRCRSSFRYSATPLSDPPSPRRPCPETRRTRTPPRTPWAPATRPRSGYGTHCNRNKPRRCCCRTPTSSWEFPAGVLRKPESHGPPLAAANARSYQRGSSCNRRKTFGRALPTSDRSLVEHCPLQFGQHRVAASVIVVERSH